MKMIAGTLKLLFFKAFFSKLKTNVFVQYNADLLRTRNSCNYIFVTEI